jgi:quinol monooxygenase YgiN
VLQGLQAAGDDSGLISYSINTAFNDPDTIWLTQLWIDKEAHDATTHSDPVVAATRQVVPLLAGQPEGSYGHVVHARI